MGDWNFYENNDAMVIGKLSSELAFNHEVFGERFYKSAIGTERLSGTVDSVPILVSDRLLNIKSKNVGDYMAIRGQFRSFVLDGHLILSLFAREVSEADETLADFNSIFLNGFLCKKPILRKTPSGIDITDLLIAVNRSYGKSDYIPCVCWGRNAKYANELNVGDEVKVIGRMQSREYKKCIGDGELEPRVAYEVSIQVIEAVYKND